MAKKDLNKIFLVLSLLLFFISLVSSAPITTTTVTRTEGLEIFYPDIKTISENTEFDFHVHVSNISDGLQVPNTQLNCSIHLYNQTGSHILQQNLVNDANGKDLELIIKGGNFSTIGTHPWRVYCNSTATGGEESGIIEVTRTGVLLDIPQTIIYAVLLGILLYFMLIMGFVYGKLPTGDVTGEDGRIIKVQYLKHLKPLVGISIYMSLWGIFYIGENLSSAYLPAQFIGNLLFTLSLVMGYALVPILIIILFKLIQDILFDAKVQQYLNRGIDFET